jgi:nicotinate-nucleotide adenylyltransferase
MTLGILGGTFDPVHNGHIAAADAAQHALGLDAITLIPSHIPPHRRDPVGATGEQRYAMVALAATERPGWSASRVEVDRQGASYTYDTLVALRKTVSVEAQYFFILGADAFAEIASWSRYPAVLDLAHFVVVSRPGITLDSLRERVPSAFNRPSSPESRVILVAANTPDISSTDIRRRVRAGHSLSGLVPDAVAEYISTQRLYLGQ